MQNRLERLFFLNCCNVLHSLSAIFIINMCPCGRNLFTLYIILTADSCMSDNSWWEKCRLEKLQCKLHSFSEINHTYRKHETFFGSVTVFKSFILLFSCSPWLHAVDQDVSLRARVDLIWYDWLLISDSLVWHFTDRSLVDVVDDAAVVEVVVVGNFVSHGVIVVADVLLLQRVPEAS